MDEKEDRPIRYSDYFLKKHADELEHSIKVKLEFWHMSDSKDELLLELVRRELERSDKEVKQE